MKHLNKLFAVAILFAGISSQAQDNNNTWALSFGVNGVDTKVSAVGNDSPKWIQLANAKENWNILPAVSYLTVSKYVGDGFSFGLTGSVNKIDRWVERVSGTSDMVSNPGDLSYYGVDATIKYSFMELLKSKWLEPSAQFGGGYTFFGEASAGTVNGGLGFTFWFTENVGFQLQSTYKHSFDDTRVADFDVPSHIQHLAGLTFKFGGPDTDSDGIQDASDACPDVAGLAEFNGCPDTDGDGIIDSEDECVDVKGTKIMKGCPDADGDGVADKNDKCPSTKGPKENAGCPWPDTDGDGVADKNDKCPTVAGTVANNGCPEISDATMKQLNDYGKTILFNSGKASFQSQTLPVLQAMTAILKEYPIAKFSLEGHTDSDGKEEMNQKLSEDRALAVKNFLIENGIDASRLSSKGFGESMPIDSNKTSKGKANNRRVEVKLMK